MNKETGLRKYQGKKSEVQTSEIIGNFFMLGT